MFKVNRRLVGQTYQFHGSTICFKRITENNGRKRFIFPRTTDTPEKSSPRNRGEGVTVRNEHQQTRMKLK